MGRESVAFAVKVLHFCSWAPDQRESGQKRGKNATKKCTNGNATLFIKKSGEIEAPQERDFMPALPLQLSSWFPAPGLPVPLSYQNWAQVPPVTMTTAARVSPTFCADHTRNGGFSPGNISTPSDRKNIKYRTSPPKMWTKQDKTGHCPQIIHP